MTTTNIIITILIMFAGLAVFMFGLKTMSERLEKQAGNRLRKIFANATDNKLMGVGVGAGVTAIIQSSSATTIMVIGFVNAGILSLTQATAIIMGANIGTTVTAILISLPITEFIAASGLIGVFLVMFSQKSKVRNVGYIIVGLGMIFTGLVVMSSSMTQFAELDFIRNFFSTTNNPFFLILIGTVITALIQSSSASTGILITLAGVGLISIENALFIILGINIGTCITALLAAIGSSVNARRAAAIHLMFNLSGTLIFGIMLLIAPIRYGIIYALNGIGKILPSTGVGAQIAAFHIVFNVSTSLMLLPFIKLLVNIALKIIPDKKDVVSEYELKYLNLLILESPSIAIAQAKKEILRMAEMAKKNFDLSVHAVTEYSLDNIEEFAKREDYIDWLNKEIPFFLTKISALHISYEDELVLSSYYHVINDIERIGDYAENLLEYAEKMVNENIYFSEGAKEEILSMYYSVLKLYDVTIKGFEMVDFSVADEVERLEDNIDEFKVTLSDMHIKRLGDGVCTAESGALFLSLISNLERIADHMRNIYNSIRKYRKRTKPKTKAKIKPLPK